MKLECIVKYNNGNEFTDKLPNELSELFNEIKKYGIIDFINKKNEKYTRISFSGKKYKYIIFKLTNLSLYKDLELDELKIIYEKLNKHLEPSDSNISIDELQKIYLKKTKWNIEHWIDYILDQYIPSPYEIIGLAKLFEICYKNNLQLYANY